MLESIGIAGAVAIVIVTAILNAWLYEKDESVGLIMILVTLLVAICALATITDIAS